MTLASLIRPDMPTERLAHLTTKWSSNIHSDNDRLWSELVIHVLNKAQNRLEGSRIFAAAAMGSEQKFLDLPVDLKMRAAWTLLTGSLEWLPNWPAMGKLRKCCGNETWFADEPFFVDWEQCAYIREFAYELILCNWEAINLPGTYHLSADEYSQHLLMLSPFVADEEQAYEMVQAFDLNALKGKGYPNFFRQSISENRKWWADAQIRERLEAAASRSMDENIRDCVRGYFNSIVEMAGEPLYNNTLLLEQLKFVNRFDVWGSCDVLGVANIFNRLPGLNHIGFRMSIEKSQWDKVKKNPPKNSKEQEAFKKLAAQMHMDGFHGISDQIFGLNLIFDPTARARALA